MSSVTPHGYTSTIYIPQWIELVDSEYDLGNGINGPFHLLVADLLTDTNTRHNIQRDQSVNAGGRIKTEVKLASL